MAVPQENLNRIMKARILKHCTPMFIAALFTTTKR
jgi:hypothetical protein